ncbi:MAG: transposase [Rubrobacteraceae bacterium]|nr:transposase [Rubrobacteraceae bacterium]
MMGTKIRSFAPLPRDLSLEHLVPEDNFYRRLEARLDLSFVREMVAPLYAKGGRPSVDPVVFFKLQIVLFCEDLRSERQLMGVVADRLSIRWYLGYDLHEPLPDHSTLTRIRERYGLEVFRGFFERIVQMCVDAGLVWGEELFFDSTAVEANAANESVVARLAGVDEGVEEHLGELFEGSPGETGPRPDEQHEDTPRPLDAALPMAGDEVLWAANRDRRDWISENGHPDRTVSRGGYRRMSDGLLSRTDPDATHTGSPGPPPASATTPTTSSTTGRRVSSSPPSSCPPTSRTTCPCSTSSGGPASAGGCVPTMSRATPSTAVWRT